MSPRRCLGGDPGGTTGLVCIDVPIVEPGPRVKTRRYDVERSVWVGHATVEVSDSKKLSYPDRRLTLRHRIAEAIKPWGELDVAVLEEPIDGKGSWNAEGRRGGEFALGSNYAMLLAALDDLPWTLLQFESYPVGSHGKGSGRRPGWMQRGRFVTRREITIDNMKLYAQKFGAPADLPDHCLMALGVLLFHLERTDP